MSQAIHQKTTSSMDLPAQPGSTPHQASYLGHRIISLLSTIWDSVSYIWRKTDHLARPLLRTIHPTSKLPLIVTAEPSFMNTVHQFLFGNEALREQKAFKTALKQTPSFNKYSIHLPDRHPLHGISLMNTSKRPANFLFDSFFKGIFNVIQPGQGLFAWDCSMDKVAQFIKDKAQQSPDEVVKCSAKGQSGMAHNLPVADLGTIFGNNSFEISRQEVLNLIQSQKIYTSSLLPLPFYQGLKEAMNKDAIVILTPMCLKDMNQPHVRAFLKQVEQAPKQYGFQDLPHFQTFSSLTLYQIGSMVIKTQNFHALVDGGCSILSRKAGTSDAIQLVDICGIRGITTSDPRPNPLIMKETFKTALIAAQSGILLVPAVGMGVWKGDPDLYWRAFLDAVIESDTNLELIGVNPGHQATPQGKYQGQMGEEFEQILAEYKTAANSQKNTKAINNLNKLYNLHDSKKDLVQLARNLKLSYPQKTVSLINASDPDVTLGAHVGEYTNRITQGCTTTEENYTALGTNGFCFEGITGVLNDPSRLFQV